VKKGANKSPEATPGPRPPAVPTPSSGAPHLSPFGLLKAMNDDTKREYLTKHLRHRLTLLRTLRERKRTGESYEGRGDIYRCVKDSNLIAVRLWLDFMGLKGVREASGPVLKESPRKTGTKYADDVKIDQFTGRLLVPGDVPSEFHVTLAAVYCRADKELAHLTATTDDAYNSEDKLIEAATAVEGLLNQRLFGPLGMPLPEMDR